MKTSIILMIIAAILFLIAGCGPGQPFEIESLDTPPTTTAAFVATAG